MEDVYLLFKLIISALLGALIGLERERRIQEEKKQNFAGFRTFMLITLFGTIVSYISTLTTVYLLPIISIGVIILVLGAYVVTSLFTKEIGFTSELSFLIAFFLGVLVFYGSEKIAVAFTILMTLILTLRDYLHDFAGKIKKDEMLEALKFAIISFVILPFLPNKTIDPLGVINPFQIWLLIVLISSVNFFSYILAKVCGGKKSMELTGIFGGFLSSTAVATSMAEKSRKTSNDSPLAFATVLATSFMLVRILLVLFIINTSLFNKIFLPVLLIFIVGCISSIIILDKRSKELQDIELKTPLKIMTVIKFSLLFIFILILSKISHLYFGERGLYFTGFVSGMLDIDVIILSVSSMIGNVSLEVAKNTIIFGLISNILTKFIISYIFGDKNFWMKVGLAIGLMLIAGFLGLLIF
ncbi:MAG: MgtC/SapB family protein [Candidatus Aenigmatarchaeota archaeon]